MGRIVKNFLRIFNLFFIIFLTGCAEQRYHTSVPGNLLGPIAGQPVFSRPLEGRTAFRFGAREEGVTLKGIVLEGSEGQEVRAAEQGRVVYVDESLRGYGRTIVLEHAQGYSTVYARCSRNLVKVGDAVRKGQVIARIGTGGKGSIPQMYFEVRRHSRPVDPETVLR